MKTKTKEEIRKIEYLKKVAKAIDKPGRAFPSRRPGMNRWQEPLNASGK